MDNLIWSPNSFSISEVWLKPLKGPYVDRPYSKHWNAVEYDVFSSGSLWETKPDIWKTLEM